MSGSRVLAVVRSCILPLLILALGSFGPAVQGQEAPPLPSGQATSALTPMRLDPYGVKDPLETFQAWRIENRVTLPVPPFVLDAHEEWQRFHGSAPTPRPGSTSAGAVPETASVGTNICPAGGVSAYQGEVAIAVNPNNASQLVGGANSFYRDPSAACQSPTGGSGKTYGTQALYGSGNGGATWTYNCAPWPSGDTGGVAGAQYYFGSDPTVAWDASNNAYAIYMLISQTAGGTASGSIVISQSTNAGGTWSPMGIVVNNLGTSAVFDDKELMAIDTTIGQAHSHTNRIYVIWDENNVERVAYSDNGTTWTTVVVDPSGGDIGGVLAVGADGTVYAAWNRYSSTGGVGAGDKLMFSKSTTGGASWSSAAQIATHNLASFGTNNKPPAQNQRGVNAFPALAVDTNSASPYFGTLYISYCDFPAATGSGTDLNAYLIKSANGGSTWSSQLKVNDDAGTATQFFPWVAVDPASGIVVLSWYDTRNDAGNKKTQIFLAESCDGGASFTPSVQVTQASGAFSNSSVAYSDENSTDNTSYNANQYGDYAQIAALSGTAWPIWTDSRQFYPSNSTNALKEDAATAAVTIGTKPGPPLSVAATSNGSQNTVTWSAGSPSGTSSTYTVLRSVSACVGASFTTLASGVTGLVYTDSSVVADQTCAYEVVVFDGVSGCSSPASACAQVTVPNNAVKPVPDGQWVSGMADKDSKMVSNGSSIAITWDTTTCTDTNYNLYYGYGSQVSTYALAGSLCGMGNTGSATWNPSPAVPGSENYIWWVIVGTDGIATESSWGKDSSGNEEHPPASNQCGFTAKSAATSCP